MQIDYTADISVVEDPDEGLYVECVEPHLPPVSRALKDAGFDLGTARVSIKGTARLHDSMELPVSNGTFDNMKDAIHKSLIARGVTVIEVNLSAVGEKRVRFDLENVSLFGN